MAYTIRHTNTVSQDGNSKNSRKNYKELSDFIPCYDDFRNLTGFKQYTKPFTSEKIYINFYDINKKFFLRRLSTLDRQSFYEKFSAYAL